MTVDTVVDRRTGIVTRVRTRALHSRLPQAFHLVDAVLADTTRFSPWPSDPAGAGCAPWSVTAAEGAAVGEAIERYCGNLVPDIDELPAATYDELVANGSHAVDPDELARYGTEQHALPGFPFVPFARTLRVRWTPGRDVVSGMPILVPASHVWVTWLRSAATRLEPRTNVTVYGGIAAGRSSAEARWSALRELVERDAVTLAWTGGAEITPLRPPRWLADLARGPLGTLSARFVSFPTELELPVMGVLLMDRDDGILSLGLGCRADPVAAALKALAEAVADQMILRQLDDPRSAMTRVAATDESPLKRWRADRAYLDRYDPAWRDVTDPGCHLQLYLDPRMQERFEAELATALAPMEQFPDPADRASEEQALARTVRLLSNRGFRICAVDVTTTDVRAAGLHVERVVVPGLVGNAPAAYPLLGSARLREAIAAAPGRSPRLMPLPH